MKKLSFMMLFMSALLMGFTFTSCSSDDEPTQEGTDPTPGTDPTNPTLHASLQGSNYYVFQLDEYNYNKIKNKVVADLRPDGDGTDETKKNLYFWEASFEAGTTRGPNFYGEVEGWPSLVTTAVWEGTGGAGISIPANYATELASMKAINEDIDNFYLHIAVKSQTSGNHTISLPYGDGNEGKIVLGTTPNGAAQVFSDFARDGEWHEFNIPMRTFYNSGLLYRGDVTTTNVLTITSIGNVGTTFQYDACFIYKK